MTAPRSTRSSPRRSRPAEGKLAVLLPGLGAVSTTLIAGVHLIRKGLAKPFGSVHADAEAAARQAHASRASCRSRSSCRWRSSRDLVFGGWDIFPDNAYEAAVKAGVLSTEMLAPVRGGARGGPADAGRVRARVGQEPRRAQREEGRVEDGPGRGARRGHRRTSARASGAVARRHGVVRLDRGLRAAEAGARDARRVREGPEGELAGHSAVDDLRLRGDRERACPTPTARRTSPSTCRR